MEGINSFCQPGFFVRVSLNFSNNEASGEGKRSAGVNGGYAGPVGSTLGNHAAACLERIGATVHR